MGGINVASFRFVFKVEGSSFSLKWLFLSIRVDVVLGQMKSTVGDCDGEIFIFLFSLLPLPL